MYKTTLEIPDESMIDDAINVGIDIIVDKVYEVLNNKTFISYLAKRFKEEIKTFAAQQLATVNPDDISSSDYINAMKMEYNDHYILLYNDSEIDISTKNISEEKRKNYPLKLSLASVVEYGIGYRGQTGPQSEYRDKDWHYDINNHGEKGWYYVSSNGKVYWTNGFEGRLVFLKFAYWIRDNAQKIVEQYLEENLKD